LQPDDAIASRSGLSQRGKRVAFTKCRARARNALYRYHTDPFLSAPESAEYLAAYVSIAVRGFSDMLILPAPDSSEPSAFLTGTFDHCYEKACGAKIARIALTTVAPERSGRNKRMNCELLHWFKNCGAQLVDTTTRLTNRGAYAFWKRLATSMAAVPIYSRSAALAKASGRP
jgi:hypothetical protein